MANASYDTLTIQINADSKQANSSISKLSNNLEKLNKTAKNLDKEKIEEMKTLLLDIAKIDFSNVSKGLQDVVNAFKAFSSNAFMKATQNGNLLSGAYKNTQFTTNMGVDTTKLDFSPIKNVSFDKVDSATAKFTVLNKTLQQFSHDLEHSVGSVLEKVNKELGETNFSSLEIGLKSIGIEGKQAEVVLNAINKELETIRFSEESIEELKNKLLSLGYSTSQVQGIIKQLKIELEDTGEKGHTALGKLANQFKNILKYRIIRKVIQDIYKMFQEGIQNVVSFDSATAEAYNQIRDSLQYLTDSLGAMIAPLIQMFAPVISALADTVADLANEFGNLFATLNGSEGYAKAVKGEKDWASEMKKTQSIGIDELNVFNQDSAGKGNFVEEQAEGLANTSKIADALKSLINILKPILNIIMRIVEVLLPIISYAIDKLVVALQPIFDFVEKFFDMASGMIDFIFALITGDFDKIGEAWVNMWKKMAKYVISIVEFLAGILDSFINAFVEIADYFAHWFGGKIEWRSDLVGGVRSWGNSFASGGFPKQEDGVFFANHTELVGKFSNGKTAVANNEEITQGIADAVREAIGGNNANGGMVINLDGQQMAQILTKRQNNFTNPNIYGLDVQYGK